MFFAFPRGGHLVYGFLFVHPSAVAVLKNIPQSPLRGQRRNYQILNGNRDSPASRFIPLEDVQMELLSGADFI